MLRIFLFIILIQQFTFGQISQISKFPYFENNYNYYTTAVTSTDDGTLFLFYGENFKIYFSKSTNDGVEWSTPVFIYQHVQHDSVIHLDAFVTNTGRIFVLIKHSFTYSKYSDDNGDTWSIPYNIPIGNNNTARLQALTPRGILSDNGDIYVTYLRGTLPSANLYRIKSTDNGITWSSETTLYINLMAASLISLGNGNEMLFFIRNESGQKKVYTVSSPNYGISWILFERLINVIPTTVNNISALVDTLGKISLVYSYSASTPFIGFTNEDIQYTFSTDGSWNWSTPQNFTTFKGDDIKPQIHLHKNKTFISFLSKRGETSSIYNLNKNRIWYGIAGESIDVKTNPIVYKALLSRTEGVPSTANVKILVDDDEQLNSVKLIYKLNTLPEDSLIMYDDGLHGDSLANDKIFGINFPDLGMGDILNCYARVTDMSNNYVLAYLGNILIPVDFSTDKYLIDVNRLKMPISNDGILADVRMDSIEVATYDGKSVIFSAGFFLSGYNGNNLWGNGVASAARITDYAAGKVGVHATDPKNIVYAVSINDLPFGESWQAWKIAVDQGANFYDGDNDGVYNPIDFNNNGLWDAGEDKPDILGDITTFCVYNDAVPPELRRFNLSPLGIEVHQTVFAYADSSVGTLNNSIFVRYKIINKGTVTQLMDSVYFGFWTDQDVGDYSDDLVGCDTVLNAGYAYHNTPDTQFGNAAPTVLTTLLQGPISYEPGVSFIDNNGNGIFDDGIDTPIDTAYSRSGKDLGVRIFPGAKNVKTTSFINFMSSHPTMGDPSLIGELRNYMMGKDKIGNHLNPCSFAFGYVGGGVNCSDVNPLFVFSGNPVTGYGWINNYKADQRTMLNTGPFILKENEPIEIIGAIVVGRKDDPFSSFYEGRRITSYIRSFYQSNFGQFPLGTEKEDETQLETFSLSQNYPNPFNPLTTIEYSIPKTSVGLVTLKIFDILGREVSSLVNEVKQPGHYSVEFEGTRFASGVYFYRLQAGSFIETKKMVLLR
ncbi:MAG TPA: exo-alpha-sialidase [Ignavibacteriaceae bacterium]|nr:exo-alpha-sialidase [Ignavibacteriaceae bacterium]